MYFNLEVEAEIVDMESQVRQLKAELDSTITTSKRSNLSIQIARLYGKIRLIRENQ